MPFIWNDDESMFIDDEEFERNAEQYYGFVIAHRLFITSNTPFASQVSKKEMKIEFKQTKTIDFILFIQEVLYKRFKKYGAIKSIEIRQK